MVSTNTLRESWAWDIYKIWKREKEIKLDESLKKKIDQVVNGRHLLAHTNIEFGSGLKVAANTTICCAFEILEALKKQTQIPKLGTFEPTGRDEIRYYVNNLDKLEDLLEGYRAKINKQPDGDGSIFNRAIEEKKKKNQTGSFHTHVKNSRKMKIASK